MVTMYVSYGTGVVFRMIVMRQPTEVMVVVQRD